MRLILKQEANKGGSLGVVFGSLVWAKLWKLQIPNKIKLFGWRACLDILPTRVNLARRKILEDDKCEGVLIGQGIWISCIVGMWVGPRCMD